MLHHVLAARAACVLSFASLVGVAPGQVRVVVYEGQQAPGFAPGLVFLSPTFAGVDDQGRVAFTNSVEFIEHQLALESGIWLDSGNDSLELVAGTGDTLPELPMGTSVHLLNGVHYTSTGLMQFYASLLGQGVDETNSGGIWSEGQGNGLELLARLGDLAPGLPTAAVFEFLGEVPHATNAAGRVAFKAAVSGPGVSGANSSGIWTEREGQGVDLIARVGSGAPGTPGQTTFFVLGSPILNDADQVAFAARLTGPGVNVLNENGIWSEGHSDGLRLLVRGGHVAPGTPPGVLFKTFDLSPSINNLGDLAFQAVVFGAGVDESNDLGIWSEAGGQGLRLIVREGDTAPGIIPEVPFSLPSSPQVSSSGHTFFWAVVPGIDIFGARGGIWSADPENSMNQIVLGGTHAPGTPDGVMFQNISRDFIINGADQVVFHATVRGDGIGTDRDEGIWATTPTGRLALVVREGDLIDLNNDPLNQDLRTIRRFSALTSSNGEEGQLTQFNDEGFLTLKLQVSGPFMPADALAVFDVNKIIACKGDIADQTGMLGADDLVGFGDFLALLGLVGPCPNQTPGCTGDLADELGTPGQEDALVGFGDFLAMLRLAGPCEYER